MPLFPGQTKKSLIQAFFSGLLVSEIISFLHVYHSNTALKAILPEIRTTGYLIVPNVNTLPQLSAMEPAIFSALFFVLTAGCLVSAASVITLFLFSRLTQNSLLARAGFLTFWILLTICLNFRVFSPAATAYTLFIPLVVMMTVSRHHHGPTKTYNNAAILFVFIAAIAVTGTLFYLKADKGFFLDTRDYLLFDTRPGRAITDFYYCYSPYATEAIKTPFKKQVKACWIDPGIEKTDRLRIVLSRYGWHSVNDPETASLIIKGSPGNYLDFKKKNRTFLSIEPGAFFNTPALFLKQYSERTDKNKNLRRLCLAGLLTAAPLVLFSLIFASAGAGIGLFFTNGQISAVLSGVSTVAVSLALLTHITSATVPENSTITSMLESSSSRTRIQGLRLACQKKKNIWKYPGAVERLKNGTIPERYWLANALALNRNSRSTACLREMIKDGSLNVRCASIRGLSKTDPSATAMEQFQTIVRNSRQWYVQQAALNALKACR